MSKAKVCVVGLGYVGLPLAYHFANANYSVVGVDVDSDRLIRLAQGQDPTGTIPAHRRGRLASTIKFSSMVPVNADYYIICVPTPQNRGKPDYTALDSAVDAVASAARDGAWLVIESTVAPGTTSGRVAETVRQHGKQLRLGCSPERVNPGPTSFEDMVKQTKLVAADNADPELLASLYEDVFDDVVVMHDTRVPELAKCFENFQRDMNIAMMNELSMIAGAASINMADVMTALRTKESSPRFHTGIVGGHCIPVDPYYLAAFYGEQLPGGPLLPLRARITNDQYVGFLTDMVNRHNAKPPTACVAIIGETYKPDVKDTRNAGGLILKHFLEEDGHEVLLFDNETGRNDGKPSRPFDVIVGLVNHKRWAGESISNHFDHTIDCTFLNVGGVFRRHQLANLHSVIL